MNSGKANSAELILLADALERKRALNVRLERRKTILDLIDRRRAAEADPNLGAAVETELLRREIEDDSDVS